MTNDWKKSKNTRFVSVNNLDITPPEFQSQGGGETYTFSDVKMPRGEITGDLNDLPEFMARFKDDDVDVPKFIVEKFIGYWLCADGSQLPGEIEVKRQPDTPAPATSDMGEQE